MLWLLFSEGHFFPFPYLLACDAGGHTLLSYFFTRYTFEIFDCLKSIFIFISCAWLIIFFNILLQCLFVLVSLLRCPKLFWLQILCMWHSFFFWEILWELLFGSSILKFHHYVIWRESVFIYCARHSVDSCDLEIHILEFWEIFLKYLLISFHGFLFSLSRMLIIQPLGFLEQSANFLISFLLKIYRILSSNLFTEIFISPNYVVSESFEEKEILSFFERREFSRKKIT